MSNGKGSRPRNNFSEVYRKNYSSIVWASTVQCDYCGSTIYKENLDLKPSLFIIYPDGSVEHKNCNFN